MGAGRVTRAAVIGSVIEWYDFALFGLAAALVFDEHFFPAASPVAGSLAAFAAFAVGFLARPVGGAVFAHFGDRVGRRPVLVATVLLMGLSTAAIGLLPTYDQIGLAAPALLVGLRVLQGLGAGAEYAGALVLVAESSEPGRRGLRAALPAAGIQVGILSATLVFTAVSALPGAGWAWRIPFLLSLLGVALGLYLRSGIPESALFARESARGVSRFPVLEVLRRQPRGLLIAVATAAPFGAAAYIINVFVLSYVTRTLDLPATTGLLANLASSALAIAVIPAAGALADRIGRRPVFLGSAAFVAAFSFPLFLLVDTGHPVLIIGSIALAYGVGISGMFAVQAALFTELFETRYRYSGIIVAREWSAALTSGPAPLVATALVAWAGGASWPIALLLVVCTAISFTAVLLAPETRGADLSEPVRVSKEERSPVAVI